MCIVSNCCFSRRRTANLNAQKQRYIFLPEFATFTQKIFAESATLQLKIFADKRGAVEVLELLNRELIRGCGQPLVVL